MNGSLGDVCSWELKLDVAAFQASHPKSNSSQMYINVQMLSRANVTTFLLQGTSLKTATNVTVNASLGTMYQYPLTNYFNVYVIAYPTNQSAY
jgi:hypothetical protein